MAIFIYSNDMPYFHFTFDQIKFHRAFPRSPEQILYHTGPFRALLIVVSFFLPFNLLPYSFNMLLLSLLSSQPRVS